jgi:hypothetical protein
MHLISPTLFLQELALNWSNFGDLDHSSQVEGFMDIVQCHLCRVPDESAVKQPDISHGVSQDDSFAPCEC